MNDLDLERLRLTFRPLAITTLFLGESLPDHRSCYTIRNDCMRSWMPDNQPSKHNLLRAIMTDVHFWIPLCVLLGGFVLLDRLS